jgi:hypothetical protein
MADTSATPAPMPLGVPNVKFFRTGDPPSIVAPAKDEDEGTTVLSPVKPETLRKFADAVREKEKWYMKILKQAGLAEKWAEEAWPGPFSKHPDALALIQYVSASVSTMSDTERRPGSSKLKPAVSASWTIPSNSFLRIYPIDRSTSLRSRWP